MKVEVLQFTAPWCGPCKQYSPIVDEFANEMTNVKVTKINVDEDKTLATTYGIRSIPTTVILQNGQLITKVTGVQSKARLIELVSPLL